jgi:hypothetical protein
MRQMFREIVAPFLTGFGVGGALCVSIFLLDIGGIRSLAGAADMPINLGLECVRFASLFGILSVGTHQAIGFVCDR